jgi:hypothetical protein
MSTSTSIWLDLVRLAAEASSQRQLGGEAPVDVLALARRNPMPWWATRLALEVEDVLATWCLVAREIEPQIATQLEALSGGPEITCAGLAAVAFAGDHARAMRSLGARGQLVGFGLATIDVDERASWGRRAIRASDRLISLALQSSPTSVDEPFVPDVDALAVHEVTVAELENALVTSSDAVVVCAGLAGSGRRTLLHSLARRRGIAITSVDARRWSHDVVRLRDECRGLALECRLHGRTPLIANIDALWGEKGECLHVVASELVARVEGRVLATMGLQHRKIEWGRPAIVVEMGASSTAQRASLWGTSLGQGTAQDAELLANNYPLAPALIVSAAAAAKARAAARTLEPDDIYAGIRTVLDGRLGQYAKRVTVSQTWEDLVLTREQIDALVELLARVRGRHQVYERWGFAAKVGKGLGVSALFSGPPGTGKTMVAGLLARDLGIDLYQVDMSRIVSKFIGETEQNLAALFDAAEAGHAILLFDEADALFGKRTDVRSSNDRYANFETNYLLQRLESFTGICLLTSNHESHLDPAFQRRLSLHLRFDLPDVDERARLWRAMLPTAAPIAAGVDFTGLARRFQMSGGYIRNATMRAAFLAADEGSAITAAHLERAARAEYEGMGKLAA